MRCRTVYPSEQKFFGSFLQKRTAYFPSRALTEKTFAPGTAVKRDDTMTQSAPSRNALCPCGSGEKYKRCCGAVGGPARQAAAAPKELLAQGVQRLRAGQAAAALPLLVAAIEAGAKQFEAYHALGTALMQTGRFADASAILTHAVALQPDSAAAFWDLGAAYDHQDRHEEAIAAYQHAVTLAPRLGDVQVRLGQLYALYSRNEEASACLDRAADAKPKTTEARLYRSDAAMLRGETAAAEDWARKAVALAPDNAVAQGGLAGILYNQGRFSEAATHFERALRLDPLAGKLWHGLAQCRKYTPADTAILSRMAAALQRGDLPDTERMAIHFAMGKVLEDCGDYPGAMAQFDAANALRARGLVFDREGLAAMVDRAIATFTPAFFAQHTETGHDTEKPIFIVGMYRSGTTLVEQILSSHPRIAAGGELTVWGPADMEAATDGSFDLVRNQDAVAKYLAVLNQIGAGAERVTDKLPTNLFRLGAIHASMPRARIIHCRRHPIDTCLSIYTTHFGTRLPFAARKEDLALYYRQYMRMMAHWRNVLPPGAMLEVDYEHLVADRDAQTRRLVAFAGVDWNDTCLRPEQNAREIGTASAWQARQPVYGTSVARWRRFEGWGEVLVSEP
jgi:tetratricopeptide (TPR) repeat protein